MQQKKSKTQSKSKKAVRSASKARPAVAGKKLGAPVNGSQQGIVDAGTGAGIGLHFLAEQLRPLACMEKVLLTGKCDWNDRPMEFDEMAMVQTESDMLQCIEDMSAIVRAQPKYKKLNDNKFTTDTPPFQVLQWLLRKLSPLANGHEWTVDTYMERKKKRFRFVIFRYYNSQQVWAATMQFPLDFLPLIKKKDLALHDMIIDVIAMVSKYNKVPLWDEDGDYSKVLKEVLESEPETIHYKNLGISEQSPLDKVRMLYSKGPAAEYLQLLKKRRRAVSIATVGAHLVNYKNKSGRELSQRQNSLVWWVKGAMQLADTRQTIAPFNFVANFENSKYPVDANRYYKFVWSTHGSDYIEIKADKAMEKDESKWGKFIPVEVSIAKPGQVLRPFKYDDFPAVLCGWMRHSRSHFVNHYTDYYYKNTFNENITPSEKLLADAEMMALKNAAK